jgi:hypothetical protein
MQSPLALSLTFAAALLPVAAMADVLIDSPGRGYREQLEHLEKRPPRDAGPIFSRLRAQWLQPYKAAGEENEPIAHYSLSDRGASERIKRVLTDAAIPYLLTEATVPAVLVKPSDRLKAKALLQKLADEGHWSVTPIKDPIDSPRRPVTR